jgi:hypothetical protein
MAARLPSFSGKEKGAAGIAHLRAFHDGVLMGKWGQAGEALARHLSYFASSAEGNSPFDLWCSTHVRPLAITIADAAATCLTAADQQTVYTNYKPRYDQVFDRFKTDFCVADISEWTALLAELSTVFRTFSGYHVWQPMQHALQKLQSFYGRHTSQPLPGGVISEAQFVNQLLSMSDVVPESVSLRLKTAVGELAPARLPAAPNNAPAGYNSRHTLTAVLTAVSDLVQQQNQCVSWGALQFPAFSNPSASVVPVASQQSVSATSSLLQASDIHAKAATMSASLQHMGAEDRCQVLAKAFPDALCPEHRMLHPLRDCPFAVSEAEKKPRVVTKHVHATVADDTSHFSEGIVKRMAQEFESVMDAKLSVFAAGYQNRPRYQDDRRGSGGGYGQSRPISGGYNDGFETRAREVPLCEVCGVRGHAVDTCWIVHPHKCKDRRRLDEIVVPEHLQGLFQQQIAKMHQSDGQPCAEPPPGDAYPPRGSAQHVTRHNHCVLTDFAGLLPHGDDSLVVVDSDAFISVASATVCSVSSTVALNRAKTIEIDFGDLDSDDSSLPSLAGSDSDDGFLPSMASSETEMSTGAGNPASLAGSDSEASADCSDSPRAVRWSDSLSTDSMPGLVTDSDAEDFMPVADPAVAAQGVAVPVSFIDFRDCNALATGDSESSDSDPQPSPVTLTVPAATQPIVVTPGFPSSKSAAKDAMVCACGSICRLQLKETGEGSLAPVWECSSPAPGANTCVSGLPADNSFAFQAFVARYGGALPASFRPIDNANVNMVTRGATRAAAQAAQPAAHLAADNAIAVTAGSTPSSTVPVSALCDDPVRSHDTVAPSGSADVAVSDTAEGAAPVESPADSAAATPAAATAQAPSSALRSGGSAGKAARQPVSFAPNLASLYKQSVPGVPGLIEASVTNGFMVLPVGDVSHMLTPQAKEALGLEGTRVSTSSTNAAAHSFAVHSRSRTLPSDTRKEASVCRLAQPEGRPKDCMFIRTVEGVLRLPRVVYADSASDCQIIKKSVAQAMGIQMEELTGRTVHMSTVGGVFSQPTVVTKPVQLVFNRGGKELRVFVVFLVADVEALPYNIILGTPVLDALGAEVDFKSESLNLFPLWSRFRDSSVVVKVPLAIKTKANPQGLPISSPVVAAIQTGGTTPTSVYGSVSKTPVAAPVLCCVPQESPASGRG